MTKAYRRRALDLSFVGALLFACCGYRGQGQEVAVRSALDVFADVVGPASKLARTTCDQREELALAAAKTDKLPVAEAEKQMHDVRKRCDQVRERIDFLRALHREAVERFEDGSFDEAMTRVEQMRDLFRAVDTDLETLK